MQQPSLDTERWNAEYRAGRYRDEPSLPFVTDILSTLAAYPDLQRGVGLYIGCGNGRNYIPLVDAGLDLYGLDVADEALRQVAGRRPAQARKLICGSFRDFRSDEPLAYIIALQVLQHGTEDDVTASFAQLRNILAPDGLFFLRVNAISTQIEYAHTLLDRNEWGGFTIRYEDGPKRGLAVHFYSRDEIGHRLGEDFEPLMDLREEIMVRQSPSAGTWSQWEGVWRRHVPPAAR